MGQRTGHDAVVIGGGPAGCAAAVTLARAGRRVVMAVEYRPRPQVGERVVDRVVDRVGDRVADQFGVGEGAPPGLDRIVDEVFGRGTFVATDHLRSLGNRAAWGSDDLVISDFMFHPFGTGWHLDRLAFDARLRNAAEAAGAVVVQAGTARVDSGAAQLVIDASGRSASCARRQGARRIVEDRLTATLAVYPRADDDDDATTTVEATEHGWWYSCPLPGHRRMVGFLTDGDLLGGAMRTRSGFENRALNTAHIGSLITPGKGSTPLVVAADTARLEPPFGAGWVAAGDAAASFDPLSSQGILTAILMGREAGRAEEPELYAARYAEIVAHYAAERRAIYQREQRWPSAPFWSRRLPAMGDVDHEA